MRDVLEALQAADPGAVDMLCEAEKAGILTRQIVDAARLAVASDTADQGSSG